MHARLTLMLAIVLVLLLNAGATLPLHAQEDRAAGLFTEARLLPLVSQSLAVRIGSGEATLVLTQVFANDGQAVGQADYHLELPREATVGAFRFWQGGKVLEAKLKARDEARKAHAAAADAGRPTALLQREASVYSFSVYPVAAGELKRVETTIQMPFETEQGRSHLRLPVDSFLGQPAASSTVLVEIDTDEPLAAFGIEGEDPKVLRRAERSAAIVMSTARAVDLWWAEQAPPLLTRVAIVPMEEGKYGAEVCVALNDASAWHAPEREVHLLVDASFSMRRRSRALAQLIDRVRHRSRTPVVVHAVGDTVITFDERARAEEILRAITGGLAGHGSSWSGFEAEMAALGCGREGILCLVVTDPQLGGLQQAVASKTPVLFLADPDELAYYEARLGEHALVYQTETEPPARLLALADGFVRPVFGSVHLDQNGIALDPSGRQDAQVAEGGMLRLYFMTDSPAPIRIEGRIGGAAIERTLEPESLEPESHHGKSVRRGVYRRMLAAMLADWSRETSDELQQRIVDLSLREGIPTAFTALQVDDPELSLAAIKPGDRILTVHGGAASAPGRGTSSDPAGADRPLRASVGAPEGGSRSPLIERVMVRAKVVELDEGGENTTAFTDTFVEDLPVLGRSYQNVLTLVPGVSDPNNDGNPNVHGARERDFKATVDGVSNVDPLTGTFSSNISPDAIEEIEVVTTGASAEYGGALGGFGKIVTRQGTNVFDGSASVSLRSSRLDGNTASAGTGFERIIYRDVHPTLHLTGPVVKDKLFFALFHESIDQGRPITLLDGAGSRSGGGGSRVVVVTKGSRSLDKLTWQVSPRHKLAFLAQADPLRRGPLGIDSLTDPKSGFDYVQGGPTYQARWDAQISSVLSVQSLLGFSQTGISLIPNTRGVKNRCAWDELATTGRRLDPHGNPGGEPIDEDACFETSTSRRSGSYPSNYRDRRIRYTLKSDASWLLEHFLNVSHNLKAGVLAEKTKFTASDSERASSVFDAPAQRPKERWILEPRRRGAQGLRDRQGEHRGFSRGVQRPERGDAGGRGRPRQPPRGNAERRPAVPGWRQGYVLTCSDLRRTEHDAPLRLLQSLDQTHDLPPVRHTLLGLVGKDRLAIHHHVEHAHGGEAHLGGEIQLFPDFPLEAHGRKQDVDSGEAALDFDVHVIFSFAGSERTSLEARAKGFRFLLRTGGDVGPG